ncbi:aminoglycoside phosphotransferase family protein [Aliiroseovarius crassostreae]|uniref:aminoglycoside phosphotransferase family protein n=1 Tax=Aliiroseovarius crassostreae TaxID=154981 RepID=UPI0022079FBB|nr:phosphotransferase [Aliiroseovarius crassostreae]UWP89005.1 phosphotransferase [Aliiroseovarius crassostreae]UWQ01654.1 phosphotransferase [Aliiroseovarius crassostreae]
MTRDTLKAAFLNENGLSAAPRTPLAGDASSRRYERVADKDRSLVLMDDPSDTGQSLTAFLHMTAHLRQLNLSAPEIIAVDLPHGFALLEDLGDTVFAREVLRDPTLELPLYLAATELFEPLHHTPPPEGIPHYGPSEMAQATDLAFLWYQADMQSVLSAEAKAVMSNLETLLRQLSAPTVLSLRDYHAENLLWLPDREGPARVGLLDYQDAVATHPIYDLVSLIRDARRDVHPDIANQCLSHFATMKGMSTEDTRFAAALIAVQRNLRILGIFARLSRQMGKPGYVDLIPRVWRMLLQDLDHPELSGLKTQLRPLLPDPTPAFLTRLRAPCPTPS